MGNQRDRVVVRCIIEEGLKFVVPAAAPNPTRRGLVQVE
jgi:cohesin complex subunit SA-1/2